MSAPIRVLLADDSDVLRRAIRDLPKSLVVVSLDPAAIWRVSLTAPSAVASVRVHVTRTGARRRRMLTYPMSGASERILIRIWEVRPLTGT